MSQLTDLEVQAAREWAGQVKACACPAVFDGQRYEAEDHDCDWCRGWAERQVKLGITDTPRTQPTRAIRRKRKA